MKREIVFGDRECGTRSGYAVLAFNADGTIEIAAGNPFEEFAYTLTHEEVAKLREELAKK